MILIFDWLEFHDNENWLLILSPELHGIPWDVVAPVGLNQEVQFDLVEAR